MKEDILKAAHEAAILSNRDQRITAGLEQSWEENFKKRFFYIDEDGLYRPIPSPELIAQQKNFIRQMLEHNDKEWRDIFSKVEVQETKLLKLLPEEQILHDYMEEFFKGPDDKLHNSVWWLGWNSYRAELMKRIKQTYEQ